MDSTPEEIRKRYEELAAPTLAAPRVALMAGYVQHGQTTTLEHVAAVAYLSLALVRKLGIRCDERALVRGALLHDYCLYDWHDHNAAPDAWHGFTHPRHALRNAEADFPDLTPLERPPHVPARALSPTSRGSPCGLACRQGLLDGRGLRATPLGYHI